jgi:hypothetical protein
MSATQTTPPARPKKGRTLKIVGGSLAVLFAIGLMGQMGKPATDQAATPQAAVATTSARPTEAPKPTAAPKPEPTIPTGMTDAAYRTFISKHTTEMGTSLTKFGTLIDAPKFDNAVWRSSVRVELLRWQRSYVSAQAATPPERFRETLLSYLAGLAKFNAASYDVLTGIDSPTSTDAVPRMDKARVEMTEGRALIEQAISQLPKD